MKQWLILLTLCSAAAGRVEAQPVSANSPFSIPREARAAPRLDFRLVRDPDFDSTPVHNSGLVAQTELSPGASVGIGVMRVAPRQPGTGEWRNLPPSFRSRKAAVKFTLKF